MTSEEKEVTKYRWDTSTFTAGDFFKLPIHSASSKSIARAPFDIFIENPSEAQIRATKEYIDSLPEWEDPLVPIITMLHRVS